MATVTLTAGTLPQPACYGSEQDRYEAYIAATLAEIEGGIQWQASEVAPVDLDLYWLRIDANGRPLEALKWSTADGAWVRWKSEVINTGTPAGAGNAYTLSNTPAMSAATAYATGQAFAFRAGFSNTGAATLNVDGLGAKTIKKNGGASDLILNDIITGQMVTVVYDGTYFQIVSPPSSTPSMTAVVNSADGSATALTSGTILASVGLTLPSGMEWKLVRVTFSTFIDASGVSDKAGIENFVLKNAAATITTPNTSRGTYLTDNSDDTSQITVTWEWVPSGGAQSANLSIEVLADKPAGATNGDTAGNRKIIVSGIASRLL